MISIIVIGRNEGWKLTKCLESIHIMIKSDRKNLFEVIYVDSMSSDDSIARAKKFDKIKIIQLTKYYNAAIARNTGAKEASGKILFFVDGDMELNCNFLSHVIYNNKLIYDCVTGHLIDFFYDGKGKFLFKSPRTFKKEIPRNNINLKTNGGIFLIKNNIWNDISGMRTKFRRCQDIDLSIRLKQKGFNIIRVPHLIANHHTINYNHPDRMWKNLFKGDYLYPSVIFRDNIFRPFLWKYFARNNSTAFVLIFSIIFSFFGPSYLSLLTFLYFGSLSLRVFTRTQLNKNYFFNFINKIINQLLTDLAFIYGLMFFYPSNKNCEYKINIY